jgi:protein-S-isoprenylcysteine O-methyltransferase Ste14
VFDAAGTNVEPWKPATALATSGVYARSRNPMYVGTWVMAVGLALGFASDWGMLLLIPAHAVLHYGVVLREERYLTAKFGEPYRDYLARVPRYGWPL